MKSEEIYGIIEASAPLETQESWDCSGIIIDIPKNIEKIMLALTPTKDIFEQAKKMNCDLIITHHPLFFVPFVLKIYNIPLYSAHTNLDKAKGGTTDTLCKILELTPQTKSHDFLRFIDINMTLNELISNIKGKLNIKHLKITNKSNKTEIKKIALCAGSGSDFIDDAIENSADLLITGDVKYHTAMDNDIILIDIGHFESEKPILETLKKILQTKNMEVFIANEENPFKYY